MIQSLFTPFLFQSAAQAITPILLAAVAGVICGRAGVFNLALEGQMLVGAFAEMIRDPVYREAVKHRQAAVEDSRLIRHAILPVGENFGEIPTG